MGSVSKRQKPNKRAEKKRISIMVFQHREKIPHPEADLSRPPIKICTVTQFNENGRYTQLQNL